MVSNCAILASYHVAALLRFLLLSQQQRHLQGMLFFQTPLHVFQTLDSPLGLLYVQRNTNKISDYLYFITLHSFSTALHKCSMDSIKVEKWVMKYKGGALQCLHPIPLLV